MSIKRLCRAFVLGTVLFGGSIMGIPMRPEEIESLMSCVNQPRIEMTIPDEQDRDNAAPNSAGEVRKGAAESSEL